MRGYVKRVWQKAGKLSNEQLISLLDDMVEENENLYSILECISAGLLIVDNDFFLKQSNKIVESRLNFSLYLDDPKASSCPIWEIMEDEEIGDYFKKCAEKGITNTTEDFTVMTSGGSVRFITITMTPLMHDSITTGKIILVRDVTEKKNQEVLLHRMENMAGLTNLAAGMAHEIKNPLGAISIHIQLIQKALEKARQNKDLLPARKFVEDHVDVVNDEIDHLNKLIMDFLFAVRPVNAQLQLKKPALIIQNIADFLTPEFHDNDVAVKVIIKDTESRLLLDEKLLRDLMLNLAQNALAAIKIKRQEEKALLNYQGEFTIECASADNKYYIVVSDNGCGMKEETVSRIFEPYFTTKANGTGLGMTMVYKIVKEFSGEISVKSQEGKGTVFTMVFPLQQGGKLAIES
ncbi:MAG: two-component sensor histidine kinase [Treponema sp.]|nr:two-component sensor histidine kinase [Treponema sp.]